MTDLQLYRYIGNHLRAPAKYCNVTQHAARSYTHVQSKDLHNVYQFNYCVWRQVPDCKGRSLGHHA